MAGFIVGFDNDPDDIFERQIEFIRESDIPLAMVGLLTALSFVAFLAIVHRVIVARLAIFV